MTSLTEKYVTRVVSRLPEHTRTDIAEEITTTLSDMVDARLSNGDSSTPADIAAAERDAISELGDPALLAMRYNDAPHYLIGPALFPVFKRMIILLLPLVGAVTALISVVVYLATEPDAAIGGMIGTVIGNTIFAVLIGFAAITILLGLGEWVPETDKIHLTRHSPGADGWSVDDLENEPTTWQIPRAEPISSLIVLTIFALIPFLPTTLFYVGHLNDGGTFVNPELWSGWIPAYLILLVILGAIEVWRMVSGNWSLPMLVARIVADLAFVTLLSIALLTQQVLDPALLERTGNLNWVSIVVIVLIWTATICNQYVTLKAYRSRLATDA